MHMYGLNVRPRFPLSKGMSAGTTTSFASLPGIDVNEEINQAYVKGCATIKDAMSQNEGWTFRMNKEDVDVYTVQDPNFPQHCLGVCDIEIDARDAALLWFSSTFRPLWDDLYHSGKVLEDNGDATMLVLERFKAIWPTSPRESMILKSMQSRNGRWNVIIRSVPHPESESKSYIRTILDYCLVQFEPLSVNTCRCYFASACSPGGSIPSFLVRMSNLEFSRCARKFEKAYKDNTVLAAELLSKQEPNPKEVEVPFTEPIGSPRWISATGSSKQWAFEALMAEKMALYLVSFDEDHRSEWTEHDVKDGVSIWTRNDNTWIQNCRGECILPFSDTVAVQFWMDETRRNKWDFLFDRVEHLETFSDDRRLNRYIFKPIWPTSAREMVLAFLVTKHNTATVILSSSAQGSAVPPTGKGRVRAEANFAAVEFVPLGEQKCRVTYTCCSHPGGSIPSFLVKRLNVEYPLILARFRDFAMKTSMLVRQTPSTELPNPLVSHESTTQVLEPEDWSFDSRTWLFGSKALLNWAYGLGSESIVGAVNVRIRIVGSLPEQFPSFIIRVLMENDIWESEPIQSQEEASSFEMQMKTSLIDSNSSITVYAMKQSSSDSQKLIVRNIVPMERIDKQLPRRETVAIFSSAQLHIDSHFSYSETACAIRDFALREMDARSEDAGLVAFSPQSLACNIIDFFSYLKIILDMGSTLSDMWDWKHPFISFLLMFNIIMVLLYPDIVGFLAVALPLVLFWLIVSKRREHQWDEKSYHILVDELSRMFQDVDDKTLSYEMLRWAQMILGKLNEALDALESTFDRFKWDSSSISTVFFFCYSYASLLCSIGLISLLPPHTSLAALLLLLLVWNFPLFRLLRYIWCRSKTMKKRRSSFY